MFGGQRCAVLGDNFHGWFARNKKNETSRFSLGIGFAKPTIA